MVHHLKHFFFFGSRYLGRSWRGMGRCYCKQNVWGISLTMRGRLISVAVAVEEKTCANSFAIKMRMALSQCRRWFLQNEDSILINYIQLTTLENFTFSSKINIRDPTKGRGLHFVGQLRWSPPPLGPWRLTFCTGPWVRAIGLRFALRFVDGDAPAA